MKLQAKIDRQRKVLAKQQKKLVEHCDKDSKNISISPISCIDHITANANEDESDDPDMESQDEEDLGYGARTGGGFTSAVSVQPHTDIELKKYIADILKGYCTAQPASPEEAVGPAH